MSLKETVQNLLKPKEVREAERAAKVEDAFRQEGAATVAYLEGKISLDEYNTRLKATYPLTKMDLRRLASELNYPFGDSSST